MLAVGCCLKKVWFILRTWTGLLCSLLRLPSWTGLIYYARHWLLSADGLVHSIYVDRFIKLAFALTIVDRFIILTVNCCLKKV
jgi:hypothetical protein